MEKIKSVIEERILNAVHKSLQWKDGEITGIDMNQLEQKVNGILALFKFSEPPSEPVGGGVKGSEEIAQKWVDDSTHGFPNDDDPAGVWMANEVKKAFLAGYHASQFQQKAQVDIQQPQVDEIIREADGFIRQYEYGDSQQVELCIKHYKKLRAKLKKP